MTTGAELQAQLFFSGESGPGFTGLSHEVYYVPRLTSYPRWFWVGGRMVPDVGDRLFVMVQSRPTAHWKAALALYDLGSAAQMLHSMASAITLDGQGYAQAVPLNDATLVVAPSALGGTYASYLDGRAAPAVGGLFQAGPNTTGYISLNRGISRGSSRYGWRDTDRQAAISLPAYALRLNTGGAVVICSTLDTVGWQAVSAKALLSAHPSARAANYVPPMVFAQRAGVTSARPGLRLTVTAIDRLLAFVQPKGVGFIYVLINNGAATSVSVSG